MNSNHVGNNSVRIDFDLFGLFLCFRGSLLVIILFQATIN